MMQLWITIVLTAIGSVAIFTAILNLFFSIGDHPDEQYASEIPPAGSDAFLVATSELTNAPLHRSGEPIQILNNGKEFMPALLTALRGAQGTINLTTYIWERGKMSDDIFSVLIPKARSGVEVRILLDGFGGRKPPKESVQALRDAGGKVFSFRPLRFGSLTRFYRRNHRRAMVIDGKIGFTGGMAIADQWYGDAHGEEKWRDAMFRVTGPMAQSLQGAFAELWAATCGEILVGERYYPKLPPEEPSESSRFISVASSPTSEALPLHQMFWFSIRAARKKLFLVYPYVIPNNHIREAIIERAKAGVDVRILSSRFTDAKSIRWALQSYYGIFLKSGIRIYEYQKARLHSKILMVDGAWSIIGSPNLDIRSQEINVENALGIRDPKFSEDLEKEFATDLESSKEISWKAWRKQNKLVLFFLWLFRAFTKQY